MTTPTDATLAIQDKIFTSIQVSQKAVVDSVRSWAETGETISSTLPKVAFVDPKPTDLMESALDFNKKLLASQKEFATKVFEAALPAASAPTAAATAAKSKA